MLLRASAILRWSVALSLFVHHAGIAAASTPSPASASQLVMGLGPALFAMIVLAAACLLLCVLGFASQRRALTTGVVVAVAGCTALFFASVKVESASDTASPSTSLKYNRMVVARAVIAAVMISFAAVALLSMLATHVVRPRQGYHLEANCGGRDLASGPVERLY